MKKLFILLISIASISFYFGFKFGINAKQEPINQSIILVDGIGNLKIPTIQFDTIQEYGGTINEYIADLGSGGGTFEINPGSGIEISHIKSLDTVQNEGTLEIKQHEVLIGDMDIKSNVVGIESLFQKDTFYFDIDTTYLDSTIAIKDTQSFQVNIDMPYTAIDLTPYLKELREEYKDTAFIGSTALIGLDQIESFEKYTAFKEYEDSTGKYKIKYVYGGGSWVPAISNGKSHYNATITVYRLFPETGYQPLAEFKGTYVEHGCFEDEPSNWVKIALEK